jgi:protease-4
VEDNSDTKEFPSNTPWDSPPPAEGNRGSDWGTPPAAIRVDEGAPAPKKPKRRSRALLLVALLGLAGAGIALILLVAAFARMNLYGGAGNYVQYEVEEGEGDGLILMIKMSGVISSEGGCAPAAITHLRRLRKKNRPPDVRAVLLWVDSPGGAVTPCDVLDDEIQKLKKDKKIKVVAFYDNVAASGGYYVSARADHIVARPTCVTGSIGVITVALNAEKLLKDKLGVEAEAITSVPYKDVPSLFRPMKEEERQYLKDMIDNIHQRFLTVVKEGRGLTDEQVAEFANGKVYSSEDALKLKMIDEIGHRDEAIAAVRKLIGTEAPIVGYRRRPSPLEAMFQARSQSPLPEDLLLKLRLAAKNRFCYLWLP